MSDFEFKYNLDKLTNRVIAYRFVRRIEMQDRLLEKFAKAGGIVERQQTKIEARLDNIIARELEIEKKTDKAFTPHESMLDSTEKTLDAFERQLDRLSNTPLPTGERTSQPDDKPIEQPNKVFQGPHNSSQ